MSEASIVNSWSSVVSFCLKRKDGPNGKKFRLFSSKIAAIMLLAFSAFGEMGDGQD